MSTLTGKSSSASKDSAKKVARNYVERGWSPIPVPYGEKAPNKAGWQKLRISKMAVDTHFGERRMNVGVLLGEPSGWLVDVDLDCDEAIALAPFFLPKTGAIFGRKSKRCSHYLYYAPGAKSRRFNWANGTLLELRSTGAQTMFPGSRHPSGEHVSWDKKGKPVRRKHRVLARALTKLAIAGLLTQAWPSPGARHDTALAVAGMLSQANWGRKEIGEFVGIVADEAGDDEFLDRVRAASDTAEKFAEGKNVTGLPRLAELLGEDVVKPLAAWLGLKGKGDHPDGIRIVEGELPQQVDEAEQALMRGSAGVFQRAGGLVNVLRLVSHLRLGYLGLLEQHIGTISALELRLPSVCYYA